jgi:hypothetical protein
MSPVPYNSSMPLGYDMNKVVNVHTEFTAVGKQGPELRAEKDPSGLDQHAPGAKLDDGKLQPWLCFSGFSRALTEVAKVTTVGAKKYTRNGWMHVENGQERYMEAFGRHMLKLGAGEIMDTDTDVHHKAAMIWNLLASLELELRENEKEKVQNHQQ